LAGSTRLEPVVAAVPRNVAMHKAGQLNDVQRTVNAAVGTIGAASLVRAAPSRAAAAATMCTSLRMSCLLKHEGFERCTGAHRDPCSCGRGFVD
jgi:hypothetical protein